MATLPELVWCGASAPVVQGFLVGLGVAAVGLVFFPFGLRLEQSGRRSDYVNQKAAQDIGKAVSLLLAVLAAGTIAGYLVIYVSASGMFCGAPLSPWAARLVVVWTYVLGATALAMVAAVVLRWRARSH